jgi:RNA polymerase II subunit A C-terminal domain phosphatase SSU72
VKLPGTAIDKPNVYEFGTSYSEIHDDLSKKDKAYYTANGILHMLDRNRRLKLAPERFQACIEKFDVIITCEERVYDQVVEFFETKGQSTIPVHVSFIFSWLLVLN